jgi:hypothetical protein
MPKELKEGTRIEIVDIQDQYTTLKTGDRGTVQGYTKTPWERQINVKWDTGSNLMLLEGVDKYRVLTKEEIKEENEKRRQ